MKRVLSLLLLTSVGVFGFRTEAANPTEDLLRPSFASLSPNIFVRSEGGQRVLEYCPDNTCERFVAPATSSQEALADFAFLYLYKVSGYYVLGTFKTTEAPARVKPILSRYVQHCPQPEESKAIACLLRSLQRGNHIAIAFTRQDEGQVSVVPINLEKQLRRTGAK
jgi:hypothetical protein